MPRLSTKHLLLFLPYACARLRRLSNTHDDQAVLNPLVIESESESVNELDSIVDVQSIIDSESGLPPGFGFDDFSDQQDSPNDPDEDQGIRNGNAIAPLPWYAVFQSRTLCGASLIHGDILLTAAHCVDDNGLPGKVRVGSNNYYRGGTVVKVVDGVLYPGWTWGKKFPTQISPF